MRCNRLLYNPLPKPRPVRTAVFAAVAAVFVGLTLPATAQRGAPTPAPAGTRIAASTPTIAPLQIEGKTINGSAFNLAALKGKVVLVIFWSTSCAVCRDKMPELRTNYAGWSGKAFELVAVNNDARAQDFNDYEHIINRTVPMKQRFVQLWAGEASYKDNIGQSAQLPTTFLIDKSGKVVERYEGRIPSQAWDRIADLL